MSVPRRELCVDAGPPHPGARSEPGRGVPRTCGSPKKGGTVHHLAECQTCSFHVERGAAGAADAAGRVALPVLPECAHETGEVIERCESCSGEGRHVRACAVWKEVTREPVGSARMNCRLCREKGLGFVARPAAAAPAPAPVPAPGAIRLDEASAFPGKPGRRINASLLAREGGYLFAWRDATAGSNVWVGRLDAAFRSVGPPVRLRLNHPECRASREDPQLFAFRGRPHVAFVGVVKAGAAVRTSVLYARLGADLRAEAVFAPKAPGVPLDQWQKNWQFFEHAGRLHAAYTVAPHKVLAIDGDRAEWAHESDCPFPWAGGEMRGGAAPVLVGDEFWSFFHDAVTLTGKKLYRVGLYAFEARPPFRITRAIPHPILTADPAVNAGYYVDVIFPRGAIRAGPDWVLSCGVQDKWTELHRFAHADLERQLVRYAPADDFVLPDDEARAIYASVVGRDEYRLSTRRLAGAAVLDVGAHVGSFARAASLRGAGIVHCYEPHPETYCTLARNAERLPVVRPFAEAIGAGIGRGRFTAGEKASGRRVAPDPTGPVPIIGLDEAITRLARVSPSGRVSLLKIDTEGGEWAALARATRLDLVDAIVGEWHRAEWNGRTWGPEDLAGLLTPHGFDVSFTPAEGWGLFEARRDHRASASAVAP